jgi:hypothetical protein
VGFKNFKKTKIIMNAQTQTLSEKIVRYQRVVDDPSIDDQERQWAKEAIDDLNAELAKMTDAPQPAAAAPAKRGRKAKVPTVNKSGEPRKPRATAAPVGAGYVNPKGFKVTDDEGRYLDKEGNVIAIGDSVVVSQGDTARNGTIISLARTVGAGHIVSFGSGRPSMVQPKNILAVKSEKVQVVSTDKPMPAKTMKKKKQVDRQDCDENTVALVSPDSVTIVQSPQVADPSRGDQIMVNKKGYPITVVTGNAVNTDYKPRKKNAGKARTDDDEPIPTDQPADAKIKPVRPTAGCQFLDEEVDAPALLVFLEGMRAAFLSGDDKEEVVRVMIEKSSKRIILELKEYDFIGFGSRNYYRICLDSGKMTKVAKPAANSVRILKGTEAMRDFMREPNGNWCRREAQKLYSFCYRNGDCPTDKAGAYQKYVSKCRKVQDQNVRAYLAYAHGEARKQMGSRYDGNKSYAQIYKEVIARLKKGKK